MTQRTRTDELAYRIGDGSVVAGGSNTDVSGIAGAERSIRHTAVLQRHGDAGVVIDDSTLEVGPVTRDRHTVYGVSGVDGQLSRTGKCTRICFIVCVGESQGSLGATCHIDG